MRGVVRLKRFLRRRTNPSADPLNASELYREAETVIIRNVQREEFYDTIQCIREEIPLERGDSLLPLLPMLDSDGLLRVGGRLKNLKGHKHSVDSAQHPLIMRRVTMSPDFWFASSTTRFHTKGDV